MTETLINIVGPILIITLIGYVRGRTNNGTHFQTLSSLVMLVATPSHLFHTFATMNVEPRMLGSMGLAAVLAIASAGRGYPDRLMDARGLRMPHQLTSS